MPEFANVHGLKETVAALRALPSQFASKNGGPMRAALFKAAKPMRDDAIVRAPVDTFNLKANIYLYRDRNPAAAGANERYIIGVRQKRRKYARSELNRRLGRIGKSYRIRGDAYYWWFVEFGTEKMPAANGGRGFLRPAFESGKAAFVSTFAAELAKGVESAARRAKQAANA